METKIGASCDGGVLVNGDDTCVDKFKTAQDINDFLVDVGACGSAETLDAADGSEFIRQMTIARSFHDQRDNADIKHCEERKITVSLQRQGSVTATVAVTGVDTVDFFVHIEDLSWQDCGNGGKQIQIELSADKKV